MNTLLEPSRRDAVFTIRHSPWGAVQSQTQVAPGIVFVSTASHGGYWLSQERRAELKRTFPDFQPWTGNEGWLEEDCDVCVAHILWPSEFEALTVYHSVNAVRGWWGKENHPELVVWLESPEGGAARGIAADWATANAGNWSAGTQGTHDRGWFAILRRIGDGAEQRRLFRDICRQSLYTDAELKALSVPL